MVCYYSGIYDKILPALRGMPHSNTYCFTGFVPELDEDGKPLKSDGKGAVGFTAFVVAGGAVALRIGGRAALISGLGLDFVTDNPELKDNLDQILLYTDNMDPLAKAGAFIAAWTGKEENRRK
jgi:hypothetical protein